MSSKSLNDVAKAFLSIKTEDDMENFLLGILTPKEQEEIAQRLAIVTLLKQGVAQHEIAKELCVGIATVTRGSKELQLGRFKNI